jgi:hypothetical protein
MVMNAKKKSGKPKLVRQAGSILRFLVSQHRNLVIGVAMVVFLASAAMLAWRKYGPEIANNPRYYLDEEKVEVTNPPNWIRTDVKSEVFRNKGLHELSLLDRGLVSKIADAFALHPWVAEVKQVRKHASRVVVSLEYRQPIAMIKVPDGLIPVDKEGVLLPTDDFSRGEIRSCLRVNIPNVSPYTDAGIAWEDQRVIDAARLADAWGENWKKLKLYEIVANERPDDPMNRRATFFELRTKLGSRIVWGHAPGKEHDNEASAETKIEALLAHNKETMVESEQKRFEIDVQTGHVKPLIPHTAERVDF